MNRKYLLILLLTGLTSTVHGQESNPSVGPLGRGEKGGTFSTGTEDTIRHQDAYGRRSGTEEDEMMSRREGMRYEEYSQRGEMRGMRGMRRPAGDTALIQNIKEQIAADETLSNKAKSVSVDSRNGRVILRGAVSTRDEKERLEEIVRKVEGTKSIENQTEIRRY